MIQRCVLEEVVAALRTAASHYWRFYVERRPQGWRWSFVTPAMNGLGRLLGGVGGYLDVEWTRLVVPFRSIWSAGLVVWPDPADSAPPLNARVIDLPMDPSPVTIFALLWHLALEADTRSDRDTTLSPGGWRLIP
jgi:hypothetical protein